MGDFFAIRDVDEPTRSFIHTYAKSRRMKAASALRELVGLAQARLREKEKTRPKYKYRSLMDAYKRLCFRGGDPRASEHVDDIVYGD